MAKNTTTQKHQAPQPERLNMMDLCRAGETSQHNAHEIFWAAVNISQEWEGALSSIASDIKTIQHTQNDPKTPDNIKVELTTFYMNSIVERLTNLGFIKKETPNG